MVLGKRMRGGRRRFATRKRSRAMVPRRMKVPRTLNDRGTVFIKRKWWVANWVPGTTTTNDFFRNFSLTLSNLTNFAEFQNLFEWYKITSWVIELLPRYDGFNGNDTTDTTLPGITNQGATRVHVNIDPLDNGTPSGIYNSATLNTFLESGSTKTYSGNRPIRIYIKGPAATDTIGGTTGARVRSRWILTSAAAVSHWGAKVFLQDINLTGTFGQSFDIFYTAYVKFKGVQ